MDVVDHEGFEWKARIAREDPARLVALLELTAIEGRPFPPAMAPFTGEPVQTGHLVFSIGNAENLAPGRERPTANLGIVSAVTPLRARVGVQDFPYEGSVYIHDAKVNPGAYGGPVVDLQGRWIGLNAKIVEAKATNTQISYAIPLQALLDLLPGYEPSNPPPNDPPPTGPVFHGISLFDANPLRSAPAYVDSVLRGSPAATAGLRPDDLILRADDQRIRNCRELERFFEGCHPGQTVRLSVKRGRKVLTRELTLEAKEE